MSYIKSKIGLASKALALVIVVGLALGPETVIRRADDALAASWRALGDHLASRQLDAIARQLDRERQDTGRIEALRDGLAATLRPLEVRRDGVARVSKGRPPRGADSERERARLEAAITLVRLAVARADRVLDGARNDLREREGELIMLRAAADARQMDRALAGPVGDPSLWDVRVACARDLLRTTPSDGEPQVTRLELSILP
jgi:hypothetical protein